MTNRDSRGRFIPMTPDERVTAHVARVNALHALESFDPSAMYDQDAVRKEYAKFSPGRPIPIEYDKPGNFLTNNWLWLTPIALALVGLVVYLVR